MWNRGVNNRGGHGNNIPANLEVEHSNKFIKAAIKNLGPDITEKAVKVLARLRMVLEVFQIILTRV